MLRNDSQMIGHAVAKRANCVTQPRLKSLTHFTIQATAVQPASISRWQTGRSYATSRIEYLTPTCSISLHASFCRLEFHERTKSSLTGQVLIRFIDTLVVAAGFFWSTCYIIASLCRWTVGAKLAIIRTVRRIRRPTRHSASETCTW